jgi:hypothetical protein
MIVSASFGGSIIIPDAEWVLDSTAGRSVTLKNNGGK